MATKIDIEQALDLEFLREREVKIKIPSFTILKIRIAQRLDYQLMNIESLSKRCRVMALYCTGLSERTLRKWRNLNWDASEILKMNLTKNTKQQSIDVDDLILNLDPFKLQLINPKTEGIVLFARITSQVINDLKEVPLTKDEPKLNIAEVVKVKNEILLEKLNTNYENISNNEDIWDISQQICQRFATGYVSIEDSCKHFNVDPMDFTKWMLTNVDIQKCYTEAVQVSNFLNASRHNSLVDNKLSAIFEKGHYTTEKITYDKIYTVKNPEGIFIPKNKTSHKKEFTIAELAILKRMLRDEGVPVIDGGDAIENMSDEELEEFIRSNKAYIKKD